MGLRKSHKIKSIEHLLGVTFLSRHFIGGIISSASCYKMRTIFPFFFYVESWCSVELKKPDQHAWVYVVGFVRFPSHTVFSLVTNVFLLRSHGQCAAAWSCWNGPEASPLSAFGFGAYSICSSFSLRGGPSALCRQPGDNKVTWVLSATGRTAASGSRLRLEVRIRKWFCWLTSCSLLVPAPWQMFSRQWCTSYSARSILEYEACGKFSLLRVPLLV